MTAGNLTAVTETINAAADQGIAELIPQISAYMTKVIGAFGKGVDLQGAPFDHSAVRMIVEVNEIEFNANGDPDLEPWIFTSDGLQRVTTFAEMIRLLPPRTEAEQRQWNEMIERKRIEFNAKRRRRTLS